MTVSTVVLAVLNLVLIVPAIILHEVSHGYVAYLLGDPTAKDAGRLTINPLAHVDIYGTIILPVLMLLVSGGRVALGYAKPVPIDPRRMTRVGYKNGMLLTGAAGPVTNILIATVSAIGFRIVDALGAPGIVLYVFAFSTLINLILAFFNLIPIPPLDGSRVVQRFLTGRAAEVYRSMERYGILIVLGVAFILPNLIGVDLLRVYLDYTVYPILRLLTGVAI
jgi:Zn-dependent protease